MRMTETEEKIQRFVLVAVETPDQELSAEESLDELNDLLETAGGEACGIVIQKMEAPSSRSYVGSGKVEEIKQLIKDTQADGIICDDELTPAQLKNLNDLLDTKIIDRSLLILDIFSQRATTKEGQMQIELAQLEYRLTHLIGLGTELSRQGAAVGTHTRGAGETKLEMDRRHIRRRIDMLKQNLKEVAENRERERASRKKDSPLIVALVGYTNAGKSTLFNRLTSASVLEEDKLFATLDTTVRRCYLPDQRLVLLVDTVGFIHKLPSHLIKAFRSTLEEVLEADLLLHVVDASHPMAEIMMKVTYEELTQLKATDKPIITVLNKQDLLEEPRPLLIPYSAEEVVKSSALTKEGQDAVLSAIGRFLDKRETRKALLIPYDKGSILERLHRESVVLEEEYTDTGVYLVIRADEKTSRLIAPYEVREKEAMQE